MKDIYILGISAFFHDSSATLLKNGEILFAAQEERFTRIKGDSNLPVNAISAALKYAKIEINDINYVVFYDKPILKFDRILASYFHKAPYGVRSFIKSMPLWLKEKLWMEDNIKKALNYKKDIFFTQHHQSHAASAFFPSQFEEAAILTVDGAGEWETTTIGKGKGNHIEILEAINFPNSLGLLYSAFTYYCGFKVNSGEYKLMGLAPYGEPIYKDLILEKIVKINDDGSFYLNEEYFDYIAGLKMISNKFIKLFGKPPHKPDTKPEKFYMDVAASIQSVTDDIMVGLAKRAKELTGCDYLTMAGGVALNCVSNSKILQSGLFKDLFIQPASGDAGGSLGAALYLWYEYLQNKRIANGKDDFQKGSYLGTEYSDYEIEEILQKNEVFYERLTTDEIIERTVNAIIEQKVIGWFQGRMEFGPRALGNRSLLGDPRSEKMQKDMNIKIKFRESFRPFAPSVLEEHTSDFFEIDRPSPYMLLTCQVRKDKLINQDKIEKGLGALDIKRSEISAVTHIDNSARIQTVNKKTNHLFYQLINSFYKKTGCPLLINTSFNVRGEPIVESPMDALRCFSGSNIDILVMGHFFIEREKQNKMVDIKEWKKRLIKD